jgi:hypothetical protein
MQAGNNYEFDLSGEGESSYAKVNLYSFSNGIKFSIKPDKNYIISKDVDLKIYLSTRFSEPNEHNFEKIIENKFVFTYQDNSNLSESRPHFLYLGFTSKNGLNFIVKPAQLEKKTLKP